MKNIMKLILPLVFLSIIPAERSFAQTVSLKGYVFESGNRGYLNEARISILEKERSAVVVNTATNLDGVFEVTLPVGPEYLVRVEKDLFEQEELSWSSDGLAPGVKQFLKIEMKRKPGYVFDVTLAEKRRKGAEETDAIQGALIEVYNQTKREEVMRLEDYPHPNFKVTFERGNHYTLLIRKKGFFNKRMEAFVNVKGCILCFEGVGEVKPGISDVLTEGLEMGTLLANVELEPLEVGKTKELKNILYNYNSARILPKAAKELDKVVEMMKSNPNLLIELGSHTDSRGKDAYNSKLSQMRAESAVEYIVDKGDIDPKRIKAKGYGETQLANKCANGVKCSEAMHQANRRTEIKVIGIDESQSYSNKSLAEIVQEEQLEAMLTQIDGEQIKIAPGEALPDEIAEDLSGDKQEETGVPKADAEPVVGGESYPAVETPVFSEPKNEVVDGREEVVDDGPTVYDLEAQGSTSRIPANPDPDLAEPLLRKPVSQKPEQVRDSSDSEDRNKLILNQPVPVQPLYSIPTGLPENYTGYMVQVLVSPNDLDARHELFRRHGEITVDRQMTGRTAYLLGDFEEWKDANRFLTQVVIQQYPTARIIRYRRGERL